MERLVLSSSPSQVKDLFRAFSGHFQNLVRHRFASHCCEKLFLQAAPIVTDELVAPLAVPVAGADDDVFVSMENLFLHVVQELHDDIGHLFTDQYASHTMRVLLVVLAGLSLEKLPTTSLLRGKKSKGGRLDHQPGKGLRDDRPRKQAVPSSFEAAVNKILADTLAGLSPADLRALATHATGNPVLQLLIELESLEPWKSQTVPERSALQKLLVQCASDGEEDGYATFVGGILYDPVGSHLLEAIVRFAPAKAFKAIYRQVLRDRIADASRSDVASFVVIRVLERLGKDDLRHATGLILLQTESLLAHSRSPVVRTIIDRCVVRGLDLDVVAKAVVDVYDGLSPSARLLRLLKWDGADGDGGGDGERRAQATQAETGRVHSSLLAQTMLSQPGPLGSVVSEGLLDTAASTLGSMAKDAAASRLLQLSLTSAVSTTVFRRRLTTAFVDEVAQLATHPVASHVVDAMWDGTRGLQYVRERIAQRLCDSETLLGTSYHGRRVWKNWKMNLFKNRRERWIAQCKSARGEEGKAGGLKTAK